MDFLSRAERRRRARGMAHVLSKLPPPPVTARWWRGVLQWRWIVAFGAGVVIAVLLRRWGILR